MLPHTIRLWPILFYLHFYQQLQNDDDIMITAHSKKPVFRHRGCKGGI